MSMKRKREVDDSELPIAKRIKTNVKKMSSAKVTHAISNAVAKNAIGEIYTMTIKKEGDKYRFSCNCGTLYGVGPRSFCKHLSNVIFGMVCDYLDEPVDDIEQLIIGFKALLKDF